MPSPIPPGATATVSIIDTGLRGIDFPVDLMMTPPLPPFTKMRPLPAWSFLIHNPTTNKKVLFDLSFPPDTAKFPPVFQAMMQHMNVQMVGPVRHVADVLAEHDVRPEEISSVIWSHHHFDHLGDVTTFPAATTELVVGPGFKDAFLKDGSGTYPTDPESWLEERYFAGGRTLREVDFKATSAGVTSAVGPFEQAYDFFGDGSFYLLNTPGHTIGHLTGLVRTTTDPDTFILMGADACHHGGEIRPSAQLSIPPTLQDTTHTHDPSHRAGACLFGQLNVRRGRKEEGQPFFDPAEGNTHDMEEAMRCIGWVQEMDAREDVWVVWAHDTSVDDKAVGVEFFPGDVNGWRAEGWKERTLWAFLEDLRPALGEEVSS